MKKHEKTQEEWNLSGHKIWSKRLANTQQWPEALCSELIAERMEEIQENNNFSHINKDPNRFKSFVEAAKILADLGEPGYKELAMDLISEHADLVVMSLSGPMAHRVETVASTKNGSKKTGNGSWALPYMEKRAEEWMKNNAIFRPHSIANFLIREMEKNPELLPIPAGKTMPKRDTVGRHLKEWWENKNK